MAIILPDVLVAQSADTVRISQANELGSHSSNEQTFDYVIVGGGTAGLTIATRLIQGSSSTVAVIEAGGSYEKDNGIFSTTPGYCIVGAGTDSSTYNPLVDWGYDTEPQKDADERRIGYPRGKTLGGCSARNFMYYHRPTAGTLEKWADEVGDDSYEFDKLLPYYQRSVKYTPPSVPFTDSTNLQDPKAWSSSGGPLQASHGGHVDPFANYLQPAVRKLGFEDIDGFSSGKLIGSGYLPFTINPETQQRCSAESSYLNSVRENSSLHVYSNTLAEKIILDGSKRATGVNISTNGTKITLHAKKEVILSAGVFNSPQLLMLSGIGPKSKLDPLNIPVQVNLPGVGENLQDHPLFGTVYRVSIPTASSVLSDPAVNAAVQKAYFEQKAGPLTIPASGFIAWEKLPAPYRATLTPSSSRELDALPSDWPEVEHVSISASTGYMKDLLKEDPLDGHNYASILTSMVAPLSRGTVTLKSANPADLPLIDPKYFSHPADIAVAIASVRRQREIWGAMDSEIVEGEYLPGADVTSDEGIFKFIKESLGTTWHAACTCKMGKEGDGLAVVDSEARVFGTKGLRVVDASAFPLLPPGHPQATVYALAEKIAEAILMEDKAGAS